MGLSWSLVLLFLEMDVRSLNAILLIKYPSLKNWQLCALLNILDVKTIKTKQEKLEMTGTRIDAQSVTVQVKDLHFENIIHHYKLRWGYYCLYEKRMPSSSSKLSPWSNNNRWKWLLPSLQYPGKPWDMFSQPTKVIADPGPWNTSRGSRWLQEQWSYKKLGNL